MGDKKEERKPLLRREVRADLDGSMTASIASYDYETYGIPKTDTETGVYWYRWYILLLFSMQAAMGNVAWNTFGPIETSVKAVFGWSTGTISLLSDWGAITFVLFVFPSSYVLDKYGLRNATLIACFCLTLGTSLRCITPEPTKATYLINTAQIIIGFAGPVGQAAATVVSSTWFPPKQRTTATAVASLASYCGTAFSFLAGPHLVKDIEDYHVKKSDPTYNHVIAEITDQVMRFMYIQCGICGGIFILVLVSFPAKPPKPPSLTANIDRMDFKDGIKKLARNPHFQLIAFAYGLTTGVYSAWCSDLALNLKQYNISDDTTSWLGFWAVVAGSASGIVLSLMADRLGALKLLIILLFVVATAGFGIFALICQQVIPNSVTLFYVTSIIGGLCLNGSIPLFFELAVESSYPVAEGINTGAMTFSNNLYCIIFLSLPLIPGVGTQWMNWFLVGSCALCIPVMMLFKERYRRLEIDMVDSDKPLEASLGYPTIS